MSRLARKPIEITAGVTVTQADGRLTIKGVKGEKTLPVLFGIALEIAGNLITVSSTNSERQARANLGTMCSLLRNAILGVSSGFVKVLEIQGVGYRAILEGKTLVISLGYVHPVRFDAPEGVNMEVEKNLIKISGFDKELVGQAAAKIRSFKKPEPYKGKGIRYQGEVVKIKAGKKAATSK